MLFDKYLVEFRLICLQMYDAKEDFTIKNDFVRLIKYMLKTVAFITGKSENQAAKKKFIRFFIDNLIANISLYALSWPKLNFGCYLTFEIIF